MLEKETEEADVESDYRRPKRCRMSPSRANTWSPGTDMQVARALGAAASARTAIAVVWNRIRRWRASIIQRRPQSAPDLDEPARVGLPDEPWQSRSRNSGACPFIPPSPEARFSLRTQGLRPKIRIDCAADDFGPQALAWSGAQPLSRTARRLTLATAASKHDPGQSGPQSTANWWTRPPARRAHGTPMRAAPCLCLGPADLRLLLRLPDSALGRAVARGGRIGFAHIRALLGLAVAARACVVIDCGLGVDPDHSIGRGSASWLRPRWRTGLRR